MVDNKHGIMMQHVTLPVFNNFKIPVPPLHDQISLTTIINQKSNMVDTLISNNEKKKKKLKQYKQSLITDVSQRGLTRLFP